MLIDLRSLCNKYKFVPSGIFHIGAHKAEELNIYNSLGVDNVIWVEANPDIYAEMRLKINKSHLSFNNVISDVDDVQYDFYVTNNGESSSILELSKHKIHHPSIHVTETKRLSSITIDTLIENNRINIGDYNFLNLDIQGAELMALKGFSKNLNKIKYIYSEVNTASLYKGCALIEDMDLFLSGFGFKRVETKMTEWEWGDAFYIKDK